MTKITIDNLCALKKDENYEVNGLYITPSLKNQYYVSDSEHNPLYLWEGNAESVVGYITGYNEGIYSTRN